MIRYLTQRGGLKFGDALVPAGTDVTDHLLASPRAIPDLVAAGYVIALPAATPIIPVTHMQKESSDGPTQEREPNPGREPERGERSKRR